MCRLSLDGNIMTVYGFRGIQGIFRGDWETSSSGSNNDSFQSSGDSFDIYASPRLETEDMEQAWLMLRDVQDESRWYRCCAGNRRCWVPARELLQASGNESNSEEWLVNMLHLMSFGCDREQRPSHRHEDGPPDPNYDRPVFEIYWDRGEGQYYVSCLSVHSGNCRCGAVERGYDLRYVPWNIPQEHEVYSAMLHWTQLPDFHPGFTQPFRDEHADINEPRMPWLLAEAVLNSLKLQTSTADYTASSHPVHEDTTVHEFVWQCRRGGRHVAFLSPRFMVKTFVNTAGWHQYWVRATTRAWRHRYWVSLYNAGEVIEV
jgi:hypothetical protein